jgi:hypothetical protein
MAQARYVAILRAGGMSLPLTWEGLADSRDDAERRAYVAWGSRINGLSKMTVTVRTKAAHDARS